MKTPRKTKAKAAPRTYSSSLREDQANATRIKILEGVLGDGSGELSIPDLARRTQISIPTIYRYFPTRASLLEATVAHVESKVTKDSAPVDPLDYRGWIRDFFEARLRSAEMLGPLADSALTWEIRKTVTVPRRRAFMKDLIKNWAPDMAEPERTWLEDTLVVLVSASTVSAFNRYVGADAAAGAERLSWLMDILKAHAKKNQKARRKG